MKTNTEFARVIDWTPPWDVGAPMPQVASNGHRTFLIYLINEVDANWDGTYVNLINNTSDTMYPLALVEFTGHTFRFGIATDEVFDGLSLWGKGLKGYAAHIVEHSTWIEELKNINRDHHYFSEDDWKDLKHFILLFHDNIFEIVAKDFKIETFRTTFCQLAAEMAQRMNEKR